MVRGGGRRDPPSTLTARQRPCLRPDGSSRRRRQSPAATLVVVALLFFSDFSTVPSAASASSAHSTSSFDVLERNRYAPLPPTVFSPGGRLHNVEETARRSSSTEIDEEKAFGGTVVALRCGGGGVDEGGECVVLAFAGPRSPHGYYGDGSDDDGADSMDAEEKDHTRDGDDGGGGGRNNDDGDFRAPLLLEPSTTNGGLSPSSPSVVLVLSPTLLVSAAGLPADSAVLLRRIVDAALTIHGRDDDGSAVELLGYPRTTAAGGGNAGGWDWGLGSTVRGSDLARRVADMVQVPTQTVGSSVGRMLSSSALIVDTGDNGDDDGGNGHSCLIWRVDPTGQFWDCDAASVGRGAGIAEAAILTGAARWAADRRRSEREMETERNGKGSDEDRGGKVGGQRDGEEDEEEEEPELNEIMEALTNDEVKAYLGSLTVDEALEVSCRCLMDARRGGAGTRRRRTEDRRDDKTGGEAYVGIRGMILHPAETMSGAARSSGGGRIAAAKRRPPRAEALSWEELRKRLDLGEG